MHLINTGSHTDSSSVQSAEGRTTARSIIPSSSSSINPNQLKATKFPALIDHFWFISSEHLKPCPPLWVNSYLVSCVVGQITAGHVGHLGELLHHVVQFGLSVVHLMAKVIQHPAGRTSVSLWQVPPLPPHLIAYYRPNKVPVQLNFIWKLLYQNLKAVWSFFIYKRSDNEPLWWGARTGSDL